MDASGRDAAAAALILGARSRAAGWRDVFLLQGIELVVTGSG
jgi:hypothetical protein